MNIGWSNGRSDLVVYIDHVCEVECETQFESGCRLVTKGMVTPNIVVDLYAQTSGTFFLEVIP